MILKTWSLHEISVKPNDDVFEFFCVVLRIEYLIYFNVAFFKVNLLIDTNL